MQVIKLSATDSTNAWLKRLQAREDLPDFTVVQASHQTAGRGQPGTRWESEPGKNLTFSVLKRFDALGAAAHFAINIQVSLAVLWVLESLGIPDLSIKWPNDILSGTKKVCGILIENQVQGERISQSIIGIGLNVNQAAFEGLPGAGSLKGITGRDFDLNSLLSALLNTLKHHLARVEGLPFPQQRETYLQHLFRKDKPSTFSRGDGALFPGIIRGVEPDGRLRVELEKGRCEAFGFKSLRLHY